MTARDSEWYRTAVKTMTTSESWQHAANRLGLSVSATKALAYRLRQLGHEIPPKQVGRPATVPRPQQGAA